MVVALAGFRRQQKGYLLQPSLDIVEDVHQNLAGHVVWQPQTIIRLAHHETLEVESLDLLKCLAYGVVDLFVGGAPLPHWQAHRENVLHLQLIHRIFHQNKFSYNKWLLLGESLDGLVYGLELGRTQLREHLAVIGIHSHV